MTKAVCGKQILTPFGYLIQDIRDLMAQTEGMRLQFVKREANMSAHHLAKYSLHIQDDGVVEYFDYIPYFISHVACIDYLRN